MNSYSSQPHICLNALAIDIGHFFIDEAQDTSQLQWKNLWPLLENALSGGDEQGSALIVGDGKQSIYRWRGSDAESFLRMLSEGEAHRPPTEELPSLMGRTEHIPLQDNWRSRKNIVTFNNQLFEAMSAHMPRPEHARTYSTAGQTPQGAEGGRVDIRFLAQGQCGHLMASDPRSLGAGFAGGAGVLLGVGRHGHPRA